MNRLRISLRILFRYKFFTWISVAGLVISVTSCWFISDYILRSLRYDSFQKNLDSIYRLSMEVTAGGNTDHYATTGKPPGRILKTSFSGIRAYARMKYQDNSIVESGDRLFDEKAFFFTNPGALDVFSFRLLSGDRATCLTEPGSVLLSKRLAEKYFGSVDVVNRQISINGNLCPVTGVFEDWPANSHLQVNALVGENDPAGEIDPQDFFDLEQYNYILLEERYSQSDLEHHLSQMREEFLDPVLEGSGIAVKFHAQPLKGLYFEPGLIDDVPKGNMKYIKALGLAGILILLISALNFINLSLTLSAKRLREIHLKRIFGITRRQLAFQRFSESLILSLAVLLLSLVLIVAVRELYFSQTGFQPADPVTKWPYFMIMLVLIIILGMVSTGNPAIVTSLSAVASLPDKRSLEVYKKVFLGFQFSIALIILISTLTIREQVKYINHKDLGFSKDQVLLIGLPGGEEWKNRTASFRDRVRDLSGVRQVSVIGGGALPGEENGKEVFEVSVSGHREERVFNIYRVDPYYMDLLNIRFVTGRNFTAGSPNDQQHSVIINAALARSLNWDNPLGETIWYDGKARTVIGVVRNFHNKSLHHVIEPIVFLYDENFSSSLLVKGEISVTDRLKTSWKRYFPDIPFRLTFFDKFIDAMYTREKNLAGLLDVFAVVSLGLCSMGLFAVFSLNMLQRAKEMSIRKILGAGMSHLIRSLLGSYLLIVLTAILIAIPVALFFMDRWLQEFAYRISLDPFISILSVGLILAISVLAILKQLIKTLCLNPANTLKYE